MDNKIKKEVNNYDTEYSNKIKNEDNSETRYSETSEFMIEIESVKTENADADPLMKTGLHPLDLNKVFLKRDPDTLPIEFSEPHSGQQAGFGDHVTSDGFHCMPGYTLPTTPEAYLPSPPFSTDSPSSSGARRSRRLGKSVRGEGSDFDSDEYDETAAFSGDDDDLDEPDRDTTYAVESVMDDEADRLGVSSSFDWKEDFNSFRGAPEKFTGPTPGPIKDYNTPYDAFMDIWTEDIIKHIVSETNRHAKQVIEKQISEGTMPPRSRLRQWKDTDPDDMLVLFAVYMYMTIVKRASQDEYWLKNDYLEMPRFRQLMSYNRFILLNKFLQFSNHLDASTKEGNTVSPRIATISPLISHLYKKFVSLYNVTREISIDKPLILFKGFLPWVQAKQTKAIPFAIKSYELFEARSGYMYKFQIQMDTKHSDVSSADVGPGAGLGGKKTRDVLGLLKGLENLGYCVTMDSLYNCPSLARYLKTKGFDCLGILRVNRRHVPDDISKIPPTVAKGTIIARHCGDISILTWKDSKLETMISSYHKDSNFIGSRAGKVLVKPLCIKDYENTVAGPELREQKLSMFLLERKRGLEWRMKIFKRLLNVSVHNAFVMVKKSLERRNLPAMTHREFRFQLASAIAKRHRRDSMPQQSEPVSEHLRLRRDVCHEPKYTTGAAYRKACTICQKLGKRQLVHSQCVSCNVYLCFDKCWKRWHTHAVLEERKVRSRKRKVND